MSKNKKKGNRNYAPKHSSWAHQVVLAAILVPSIAGLTFYFYKEKSAKSVISQQETDEIQALENLAKNTDYKTFTQDRMSLKDFPSERKDFYDMCKSTGKDPEKAEGVIAISQIDVSLLPDTPAFRKLEDRLNNELANFENALPKELLKKKHKVVLLSQAGNLESLPFEKDRVIQIYLINSGRLIQAFEGKYNNERFSESRMNDGLLGEASANFLVNPSKEGISVKSEPNKIYVAIDHVVPKDMRYAALLHTLLSEYLHSSLTDLKKKNYTKICNYLNEQNKFNLAASAAVISDVSSMDEGITHTTVLTYLEEKHPAAVKPLLERLSKHEEYKRVNDYFEAIHSEIFPGAPLDRKTILYPLLNMWHKGEMTMLQKGKPSIIEFIRSRAVKNNK